MRFTRITVASCMSSVARYRDPEPARIELNCMKLRHETWIHETRRKGQRVGRGSRGVGEVKSALRFIRRLQFGAVCAKCGIK